MCLEAVCSSSLNLRRLLIPLDPGDLEVVNVACIKGRLAIRKVEPEIQMVVPLIDVSA